MGDSPHTDFFLLTHYFQIPHFDHFLAEEIRQRKEVIEERSHDFSGKDEELRRMIQTNFHVEGGRIVTGLVQVDAVTSIYSTMGYLSIGMISLI